MITVLAHKAVGLPVEIRVPEPKHQVQFLRGIKTELKLSGDHLDLETFQAKGYTKVTKSGKVLYPLPKRRNKKMKNAGKPRQKKFKQSKLAAPFRFRPNLLDQDHGMRAVV